MHCPPAIMINILYTGEVPHLLAVLVFMFMAFVSLMPTDSLSIE